VIRGLLPSWERSLRARRKSPQTIVNYMRSVNAFIGWLVAAQLPTEPAEIRKEHLESFIVACVDRGLASSTVASHHKRLKQLFRWLKDEDEITVDPMANMPEPQITQVPPEIMPDDDIKALFKDCAGPRFEDRRDTAIFRLFLATGMRLAEMAGIDVADINWNAELVRVRAKGDKILDKPFGPKAGEAIDRYLRARARHRLAGHPGLWLGQQGRLTSSGIYQITMRRSAAAGITHVHPHLWRHKFSHEWCLAGGSESDLMSLMGWESSDMPRRYGASAADERARQAHRRMGIGEDI